MKFTPRLPQHHIYQFAMGVRRGNIFASPGTGKTGAGYTIYDMLRMMGDVKRCLVLGPKRVAKNVWPSEREKWIESFGHLKVAAAIGTPEQRKAAVMSKPDLLSINYENIDWLVDGYGEDWPFDMVLADESTRIKGLRVELMASGETKGQGSTRAKALSKIAHSKVRHWYNLTGSPAPNGVVDLWGQQWFVDGGLALGTTFKGFEDRWFHTHRTQDGYVQRVPHSWAQAEIEARMRSTSVTIDVRDYYDIAFPIERILFVDLPSKLRPQYLSMEKELFANIEKHAIEVFTAGGKSNKLLQMANGSVFYDTGEWVTAHDEKLEALKSLVEEFNGEPILVRYIFKPDRDRILKAFPRARLLDDKKSTEDAWNRGEIPLLVTHAASAGHGLSLQMGGRVLIDYGSNFNLEDDEQIIERIGPTRQFQAGLDRAVYRTRIIARDTIEEHSVLPRLQKKISVQDAFKEAMKIRR